MRPAVRSPVGVGPALLLALAFAFGPPETADAGVPKRPIAASAGKWLKRIKLRGTRKGRKSSGRMSVYLPRGYAAATKHPLLIALHGWNGTGTEWQRKSRIAALADRYGLIVACPTLGRSVYETERYPGRRTLGPRTPAMAGTHWVGSVVLPALKKRYSVCQSRSHLGILGFSTGGRGAVMVAQHYPAFGFVASLSGTFDLARLSPRTGEYRIHAKVYGPRSKYTARWKQDRVITPARLRQLLTAKVFLGHGRKDHVVSFLHTQLLADALRQLKHPALSLSLPYQSHNWRYWNAALPKALAVWNKQTKLQARAVCK